MKELSLVGSVRTLSLSELFQFLQASGHSGTLEVFHGAERKTVYFQSGEIVTTTRDRSLARLGDILIRQNLLKEKDLYACLAEQKASGQRLGDILVARGLVQPGDITTALRKQQEEELIELFFWEDAFFEFGKNLLPEHIQKAAESGPTFSTQNIVMEGARRLDEWSRINALIPSTKQFFRCPAEGLPEAIENFHKINAPGADKLRLDGATSLESELEVLGLARFDAMTAFADLVQAEKIEPIAFAERRMLLAKSLHDRDLNGSLRILESLLEDPELETEEAETLAVEVFSSAAFMQTSGEVRFSAKTSGRLALALFIALFKQDLLGTFTVRESGHELSVFMGQSFLAMWSTDPEKTPNVGRYILKVGRLTEDDIRRAQELKAKTGKPLQQILLGGGILTREEWSRALREKILEEIVDMFFWKRPHLEFIKGEPSARPPRSDGLFLKISYMKSSVRSRIWHLLRKWRRIAERVPSEKVIFKFDPGNAKVSPDEPFALFTGNRTVEDLIRLTKAGRQEFYQFLYRGMDRGLVRQLTEQEYGAFIDAAVASGRHAEAMSACMGALASGRNTTYFQQRRDQIQQSHVQTEETEKKYILTGNLDDFNIAEVLQSLRSHQHSGTLRISDGERQKSIYFSQGDVFLLNIDRQQEGDAFLNSVLGEETVKQTEEIFGGDLVERGFISEGELSDQLMDQIKEELHETFLWDTATFQFTRDQLPPEFFSTSKEVTRLALNTDAFLLEAVRRINEWDELKTQFPNQDVIYVFRDFEAKMEGVKHWGNPEVLYLIDGKHSLDEIVRISGRNKLAIYGLFRDLATDGLVRLMSLTEVLASAKEAEERGDTKVASKCYKFALSLGAPKEEFEHRLDLAETKIAAEESQITPDNDSSEESWLL